MLGVDESQVYSRRAWVAAVVVVLIEDTNGCRGGRARQVFSNDTCTKRYAMLCPNGRGSARSTSIADKLSYSTWLFWPLKYDGSWRYPLRVHRQMDDDLEYE